MEKGKIEWNERPIVRVEATVMVRGELGWTPHLGAGHSKVAVYESMPRTDYRLYGYRIQDKEVTLDTLIPPQMIFVRASAIFHHWVIGQERMGLAFNGTADARSFDRGIRVALENLDKPRNMSSGSSTCSRTSEEASPTSVTSFTILNSADVKEDSTTRVKKLSTSSSHNSTPSATSPHPASCPRPSASISLPAFRQPATSTSSLSWHRPSSSRLQRRHSSSVPGHPQRASPTPPSPTTVLPGDHAPRLQTNTTKSKATDPAKDVVTPSVKDATSTAQRHAANTSRRHRIRQRESTQGRHKSWRTKTPNLDILERQRDLQPPKPNSYVQIPSATPSPFSTRPGASLPTHCRSLRTSEDLRNKYASHRYTPQLQRTPYHDYRYHGMKSADDCLMEQHKTTLFHTSPSFGSYTDPIKPPASTKSSERGGRRKEDLGERTRCRYCQVLYNRERNPAGSCPAAPVNTCPCFTRCSNCLPGTDENTRVWTHRRWCIFAIVSIFIPCLCLYPILKNCHRCGAVCHCCGGKHKPMPLQTEART
ncbi:sprouty-related, EVH1 domain-containing protein 2-like [Ciona intestinalis]